ncbi:hypothetical protein GCM10010317_045790 [Streptomyces mirabilis]|jgi:hypothetical protein|nr:hypothetical protein BX281_6090 [Streptomyces sp. Ag82_O1-15]GHD57631.1 hypothetical protein GCM10010317_045790 [Streptomyces mirabilis]SOE72964.1 hypothetical protein SAMN05446589_4643 [Streptomyces sp. OV198]
MDVNDVQIRVGGEHATETPGPEGVMHYLVGLDLEFSQRDAESGG